MVSEVCLLLCMEWCWVTLLWGRIKVSSSLAKIDISLLFWWAEADDCQPTTTNTAFSKISSSLTTDEQELLERSCVLESIRYNLPHWALQGTGSSVNHPVAGFFHILLLFSFQITFSLPVPGTLWCITHTNPGDFPLWGMVWELPSEAEGHGDLQTLLALWW